MPRPRLARAIKKIQEAGQKFRPGLQAAPTPRAAGTQPKQGATLAETIKLDAPRRKLAALVEAFSPKGFVLPEDLRIKSAISSIKGIQKAAQSIASVQGVSFREAGVILRETGAQIMRAKKLRTKLLRAQPGLSEGEQIKALRGGGLSGLARQAGPFVSREIAGFVVLGGSPQTSASSSSELLRKLAASRGGTAASTAARLR